MTRRMVFVLSAVAALAMSLTPGDAAQKRSLSSQVVGSWTLVSADAFGDAPKGVLMFDRAGHFSSILTRASLPAYPSNNRTQGTADDYKSTVAGSLAFFGTYSVSGTDLNLHIESSTFPNWIGTDQKRIDLTVSGNELKYTQPSPSGGGGATPVVWKRDK
jgi:Lipocalin-like domain